MKKYKVRQYYKAFSLVEMVTVVAIAAILMAIALPNVPGLVSSSKMSSAKNTIKTMLAQAQGYAIKNGVNTGVRFQKASNGITYMVMIINKPKYKWYGTRIGISGDYTYSADFPNRYVAKDYTKPKALPKGISVISGSFDQYLSTYSEDEMLTSYEDSGNIIACFENMQTFSIVFSPNGQLITTEVQVQPRRNYLGQLADSYGWIDNIFGPADLSEDSATLALLSYDNFTDYIDPWDVPDKSNAGTYSIYNVTRVSSYCFKLDGTTPVNNSPAPHCLLFADDFDTTTSLEYMLYELSASKLFIYFEDELKELDQDNGVTYSRYTDYFSLSSDGGKQSGCVQFLINKYTGDVIESGIEDTLP